MPMRIEAVEIYSDATNAAVLRHPDRRFPGLLIQGDTLHSLYAAVEGIRSKTMSRMDPDTRQEMDYLRGSMRNLLSHYESVLREHGLPLPFGDMQSSEPLRDQTP
jgi:hypothetical protein